MANEWENHRVTGRNRLPARAYFIPFADEESALRGERGDSPWFQLLNGDWHFRFAESPAEAPKGFEVASYDAAGWDRIMVPCS